MIKKIGFFGLIAIIVFFLMLGISSYFVDSPKEIIHLNYTFAVKENVGINLDTDKLNFGGATSGASLQRSLNVVPTYDTFIHIESIGPGTITVSNNDIEVKQGESVDLLFSLYINELLSLGEYEGTVLIYFYER